MLRCGMTSLAPVRRGTYSFRMTRSPNTRLTRQDWVIAGLEALRADGPAALKAEALARGLGTTKGSFYWHFDDLPAFQAALIAAWEETARPEGIQESEISDPVPALRQEAQTLAVRDGTDAAMRAWALSDGRASMAVERVDAARAARLGRLLKETDIANPQMVRLIQATGAGMALMPEGPRDIETMGSLVDLILALR